MRRPRIAVTLGDPCGIGPELLLKSLHGLNGWADVLVAGSRAGVELLEGGAAPLTWHWQPATGGDIGAAWTLSTSDGGEALWMDPLPQVHEGLRLGEPSADGGRCAVESIRRGARLAMEHRVDALVTLPLSKSAAHAGGFTFPGHTEFLQALCAAPMTRMAFVSPRLNVVLHTVHQSLRSVIEELDVAAVSETLAFAALRMAEVLGKPDLRVALCALNPHAGEGGAFGGEERLLVEAIEDARMRFDRGNPFPGLPSPFPDADPARPTFHGPLSADSLFHRAASGEFDVVVALYHDQGLIPVKTLEPLRAVNLTLGLPILRTSPDHGTAFDKAGLWKADPRNFMEATALAVRLAGRVQGQAWRAEVPI
ncbi:MAG TPA: 4-hydroxythreonine-4-phosphate dehydrogenase PdxA [Holophagaceae bacterium]|nr:4-hydroxythreonine-4-phosphate dehydrogenase PdxA [Holophagaceae bacterium]